MKKIILASNSPRRRDLLKRLQIPFEAHSPHYLEENQSHLCPAEEALLFARKKARSLEREYPQALIIGCDTLVEIDGKKLGKPTDETHALEILQKLSGRIHRVLTGVSVWDGSTGKTKEFLGQTLVKMKEFTDKDARDYIATGEPFGKAGAYAIQGKGGALVEKIEGDYFNVVGLPLKDLAAILKEFGVPKGEML